MTLLALLLLLAAAMMHAVWNFLAKRAGGGFAFVWLIAAASSVLYLLPAAALCADYAAAHALPPLPTLLLAVAGSGSLHIAYFLLLQWGYREGDLSVVYPLARGSAPVWSVLGAFLILREHPSPLGLLGAGLVVVGVLLIASPRRRPVAEASRNTATQADTDDHARRLRRGRLFGLVVGLVIAGYTLWDGRAVTRLHVPPLLLDFGSSVYRTLALAPFLRSERIRADARDHWRVHRAPILWIALLSSLAYIAVLSAMRLAPISHIAPAREVSIVFGVLLGSRFLGEAHSARRAAGAALIVAGVIALTFG